MRIYTPTDQNLYLTTVVRVFEADGHYMGKLRHRTRPCRESIPCGIWSAGRLLWDVRLLDEHGVLQYSFGSKGLVDLKCSSRSSVTEKTQIEAVSNINLQIEVQREGGREILDVKKNRGISNE
jgi:hypothetical protein